MPTYLVQVSYTDAAWANLVADPHDRTEAVRPVVEGLGGRMISAYLAFGDYDVVLGMLERRLVAQRPRRIRWVHGPGARQVGVRRHQHRADAEESEQRLELPLDQ